MTEKERIEKFKSHDLAVNCRTEDEAKKFVEWCYKNGFKWFDGDFNKTNWHKKTTCYRCYEDETLCYEDIEESITCDYEVMTYQDFFKEDEMTNFEYLIENLKESYNDESICFLLYTLKNGSGCGCYCKECEFNNTIGILNYLSEKHSDKIKVTQFEYDLLNVYITNAMKSNYNQRLTNYNVIVRLKEQGYFKNLNLYQTIGQIKDLLEVEK